MKHRFLVLLLCWLVFITACGDTNDISDDTAPPTAANSAPTADAGASRNVATGSIVTLDGSGSTDTDGDPLTYAWTFTSIPSGSSAALSNAATVAPSFTADEAGAYVLRLTVNDGTVNSAPDTVTITAEALPPAWGTAEWIESDDTGNADFPQIAMDESGNAVAVCQQSDGTRTGIWANSFF